MFSRHIKRCLLGTVILAAASPAFVAADSIGSLPVKTVGGHAYHYYTVKPDETLYALSKRFGVSTDEIIALNPSAADGIKYGQDLLLGKAAGAAPASGKHVVKKQETAYGISKRYGLSLDEFYALNPSARDGVREGQTVIVSNGGKKSASKPAQTAAKQPAKQSGATTTHTIAEHETLYQIARDNNLALSDLLAANPGLDAARYTAGTVLIIPTDKARPAQTVTTTPGRYTVRVGDTFYGIATRHGLDVEQLRAANPGVEMLTEGATIVLPQACAENQTEATEAPASQQSKLTIGVVLPFNLAQKGKHNKAMVDFYRGFLLAVDSMRNNGRPIHVITFDNKGTGEGMAEVLSDPRLRSAQAIIGPDGASELQKLNEFGRENRIAVFNFFNNRDSAYLTNPYAMQAAIGRDDMYDRAAKAFVESFADYTPVILVNAEGRKDKVEFADKIKAMLKAKGRNYKEINFTGGTLALETLTQTLDPTQKYAFLPTSSHKEEFGKIESAVRAYKDSRDFKNEIVVWGYPEWLANRAAYEKMHDLDTYVYSRNDLPEAFVTSEIDENYNYWFGPHMLTNYPRRAYMGFDAGMYIIKALMSNGGDFQKISPYYSGVSMPISFTRIPSGGWINNELLMINLAPGSTISKRTI